MSKHNSHLNSAVTILRSYKGDPPFHLYIKKYFAANKKYGSGDRKEITSLCYNYFRLGHTVSNAAPEEKILLATFICEEKLGAFLAYFKPEWNDKMEAPLAEKLAFISTHFPAFKPEEIFPFKDELSDDIDELKFSLSFLIQPKLFLRIRPGHNKRVVGKINGAGIRFQMLAADCLALPNSSKINSILAPDKEAVIQDFNSQETARLLKQASITSPRVNTLWDCCAGSGGKSIMAYDIVPGLQLTVSDKRNSVLVNLAERFKNAGIKNYRAFAADLTTLHPGLSQHRGENANLQAVKFDYIIADVPCSGSGTWSRTPEQLFYFNKKSICKYASQQKQILTNVISLIKPGGYLQYITCSVFKKENEEIIKFIVENFSLDLVKKEMFNGCEMQADTLFTALFKAKSN
ncbi:MAG: Fmu (Sun) domain-containing protein [Chitinophagaceae bacterium]|nr:Fmu (Sun) domain-containing protein [Chitinophagaceae bacterium]